MDARIVTLEEALSARRADSVERFVAYINPPLASLLQLIGFDRRFVRAEGCTVVDDQGVEFLDCLGGYGSLNLGHNHPELIAALRAVEQAPNLLQAAMGILTGAVGQSLAAITPGHLGKTFLCNSGAEAVEGALKLARISTGRAPILYAAGSFHGKSMGALSVTGREKYQKPFAPLVPECYRVPYGDMDDLAAALRRRRPAAFIVEPVQGEGGIIVPPEGYLAAASSLCRAHGALLIVDEIQTGFGRTGVLFGCQHEGVEPDIMVLAKSLGGGVMPVAAVVASDDVWRAGYGTAETCLLHTSTFGGNARACAAALKSIEITLRDDLPARAATLGERFKRRLEDVAARSPLIREVRGRGLFLGVEFAEQRFARRLSREYSAALVAGLLLEKHRIITAYTLNNPNVIRFEPPLVITEGELNRVATAFDQACSGRRGLAGLVTETGMRLLRHRLGRSSRIRQRTSAAG